MVQRNTPKKAATSILHNAHPALGGFFFSALFCALISLLNGAGIPFQFKAFPLASAYRFMDALQVYALSCMTYFSLCLFASGSIEGSRTRKRLFFVCSFAPVLLFAGIVLLNKELNASDIFAKIHFSAAWSVSGICSVFALRDGRSKPDSRRIWAWGTIVSWISVLFLETAAVFFRTPGIIVGFLLLFLLTVTSILAFAYPTKIGYSGKASAYHDALVQKNQQDFRISDRESEIIALLLEGKTNQEIADALYISLSTVKTHMKNIFEKTGTRNRMEVANILRATDHPKV